MILYRIRSHRTPSQFRGFWEGLAVGSLIFAIFLAVGFYLQ